MRRFFYILKCMSWEGRMKVAFIFSTLFIPMCFMLERHEWPILLFWAFFSWIITYVLID